MPELPEVETVKRSLSKTLIGRRISAVLVFTDKMVAVGSARISNIKIGSAAKSKEFAKKLIGLRVTNITRRAKFLIIHLARAHGTARASAKKYFLVIHLRMSGQLIYIPRADLKKPLALSLAKTALQQTLPTKHTHIEIAFTNGDKLFYNDTRQFGHMRLVNAEEFDTVMKSAALGSEPLELSLRGFQALTAAHPEKRAKDFLLNQQIIAGIGNIYADESLFASRIHPRRKIKSLSAAEIRALHTSIKKILNAAINSGGSSIEYFLATNGAAGKFSEKHLVYAKKGKPCPRCGKPLASAVIGSRTSTFCSFCQGSVQ